MKKLLIICLALIIFLTSCDLSYFKDWEKTPDTEVGGEESNEEEKEEEKEPELPHSEMVALSDLINRDDVDMIVCDVTQYFITGIERYRLSDVDEFLDLFLDANADLQCITDVPEVYDLFDEQIKILRESERSNDEFIYFDFFDCNNEMLITGTIYPNGMIGMYIKNVKNSYVSIAPLNTNTADFINFLRESNQ